MYIFAINITKIAYWAQIFKMVAFFATPSQGFSQNNNNIYTY